MLYQQHKTCTIQYHQIFKYFDIHGAQYHDTIFNQCIDILPYVSTRIADP